MAANNNNNNNNGLTPEIMKSFIDVQKKKMDNESKELNIKDREISSNEKIALKTIELQASLLKDRPREMRKNLTRLGWVVGGFLILVFAFLGWLLYSGNERFANMVIDKGSYLIVAIGSYIVGKKNGKNQHHKSADSDIEQLD